MTVKQRKVEVLSVEDNEADVGILRALFSDFTVDCNVKFLPDGEAALDYLKKRGAHTQSRTPDIILLDLNLPKRDGLEVLAEIKSDPTLKKIPVVILSTSSDRHDITRSYELGASSFLSKPSDLDWFSSVMASFENYWLKSVELPLHGSHATYD